MYFFSLFFLQLLYYFTPTLLFSHHQLVARVLVDHGADVNARDEDSLTLLHLAVIDGRVDLIPLLIEHGADAGAKDKGGLSPLDMAVDDGQIDLARVLVVNATAQVCDSAPVVFGGAEWKRGYGTLASRAWRECKCREPSQSNSVGLGGAE